MSNFSKWLDNIAPVEQPMAWFHNTDAHSLRSIFESGVCATKDCKVFSESLLYLFYGRPAFRIDNKRFKKPGGSPVSMLFEMGIVRGGKRIYPFDTGAFHNKRLDSYMHPEMKMQDFEMHCNESTPRKHIAAMFGTNQNYLISQAKEKKDIPDYSGVFEVSALLKLLNEPLEDGTDDRVMAIELQIGTEINVHEGLLKAVIYPDELTNAQWLNDFRKKCGNAVAFSEYECHHHKLATEYQVLLELKAKELQRQLGLKL